ncbi:glycosyltransferase family 4 protein [bacterium]|nr:glycosyltransferase family 4 protein [bacterium]
MIRIVTYPDPADPNPYFGRYYGALAAHGFELVGTASFGDDFLRGRGHEFDVLHVHWAHENIWRVRGPGRLARLRGVVGLWRFLRLARRMGKTVVWTAHDLESHEGRQIVDRLGNAVLARTADLVICHSEYTRDRLIRRYWGNPRTALVTPLGNYDGVYPPPRPRAGTFARFGLDPTKRTLVAVGLVRPYKGFDLAVEAARQLGDGFQLVVAGPVRPGWEPVADGLRKAAAGLANVRFEFRHLDDAELVDLHSAADCVLLPYRWITGSGALLTTLTLGRAVVASDLPYFRETLAADPEAVEFFPAGDVNGLVDAIRRFFAADVPARHAAARRAADRFPWAEVIKPVAARLHELRGSAAVGAL